LLGGGVLADREVQPSPCLAVWLDRGSGLPVASFNIQPDRQGMGSFRLALLPCKSKKPG